MLIWRMVIGVPVVLLLIGLCILDNLFCIKGIVLLPLFGVCLFFLCKEFLDLLHAGGLYPRRFTVYGGTLLMTVSCWVICVGHDYMVCLDSAGHAATHWEWAAGRASMGMVLVFASGILVAFAGEMWRYKRPGGVTINLAGAVFAMAYLGLLACFLVLLRMVYGIGELLSYVMIVKMNDIGAYTVGRLLGRHKMAPELSPKKTIEGGLGGLAFALFGSWFSLTILMSRHTDFIEWFSYGIAVALAGALGDLAGSLIKRDVQIKDSGTLVPGFGGFLDIFDSLLIAAPVAFFWWTLVL
ncbi:MAG: phosphatidate cytidylyltransferase [Planctomycetaceae bacterium]|jgi:phosphatidate cytidylyltransferase|nr:phosphatidate cytidylyltransferase [Planctomycetaceae bacterium]